MTSREDVLHQYYIHFKITHIEKYEMNLWLRLYLITYTYIHVRDLHKNSLADCVANECRERL